MLESAGRPSRGPGRGLPAGVGVRFFTYNDAARTAALHARELPGDFLTRFGEGFLRSYHLAFAQSPHAVVAVADDRTTGRVVGALFGTLDTRAHYDFLVRRHGPELALRIAARSVRDPGLARDLLRSRAKRYVRGVVRSLFSGKRAGAPEDRPVERVGMLAHVMVAGDYRQRGVGAALAAVYEARARAAGLDRLELVTFPDDRGAGPFYERIGWQHGGERVSRSGERFEFYSRLLTEERSPGRGTTEAPEPGQERRP